MTKNIIMSRTVSRIAVLGVVSSRTLTFGVERIGMCRHTDWESVWGTALDDTDPRIVDPSDLAIPPTHGFGWLQKGEEVERVRGDLFLVSRCLPRVRRCFCSGWFRHLKYI